MVGQSINRSRRRSNVPKSHCLRQGVFQSVLGARRTHASSRTCVLHRAFFRTAGAATCEHWWVGGGKHQVRVAEPVFARTRPSFRGPRSRGGEGGGPPEHGRGSLVAHGGWVGRSPRRGQRGVRAAAVSPQLY